MGCSLCLNRKNLSRTTFFFPLSSQYTTFLPGIEYICLCFSRFLFFFSFFFLTSKELRINKLVLCSLLKKKKKGTIKPPPNPTPKDKTDQNKSQTQYGGHFNFTMREFHILLQFRLSAKQKNQQFQNTSRLEIDTARI